MRRMFLLFSGLLLLNTTLLEAGQMRLVKRSAITAAALAAVAQTAEAAYCLPTFVVDPTTSTFRTILPNGCQFGSCVSLSMQSNHSEPGTKLVYYTSHCDDPDPRVDYGQNCNKLTVSFGPNYIVRSAYFGQCGGDRVDWYPNCADQVSTGRCHAYCNSWPDGHIDFGNSSQATSSIQCQGDGHDAEGCFPPQLLIRVLNRDQVDIGEDILPFQFGDAGYRLKQLSDVVEGDYVLSAIDLAKGLEYYTVVEGISHYEKDELTSYILLTAEDGSKIAATSGHFIPTRSNEGKFFDIKFAEVTTDHSILTFDGYHPVTDVQHLTPEAAEKYGFKGLINIVTASHTIMVQLGVDGKPWQVATHADINAPRFLRMLQWVRGFFGDTKRPLHNWERRVQTYAVSAARAFGW